MNTFNESIKTAQKLMVIECPSDLEVSSLWQSIKNSLKNLINGEYSTDLSERSIENLFKKEKVKVDIKNLEDKLIFYEEVVFEKEINDLP